VHRKQFLIKLLNAILFNVAWLLCVLGGNQVAIASATALLLLHFLLISKVHMEFIFILVVAFIGFSIDSFLFSAGVLVDQSSSSLAPWWLLALWLCFATTLNHCFQFLHQRLLLAAILGPLSGTLSYLSGANLSGLSYGVGFPVVVAIHIVCWAILFPLFIVMARKFSQYYQLIET